MATVSEIYGMWGDSTLRNHAEVCVVKVALEIQDEEPPANSAARLAWATAAFNDPRSAAVAMVKYLLAANSALTIQELQAAVSVDVEVAESPLLAAVRAAVDIFADGS